MRPAGSFAQFIKGRPGEWLELIALAVILAIVMRMFLFEPSFIPSLSMYPVLQPGDRIIVNKIIYRLSVPKRGDIVVFRFPLDEKKYYIKRIIGLPGETIEGKGNSIFINGKAYPENYLPGGVIYQDFGPVHIPKGEYLVLGDNRGDSFDSRSWGTLPENRIQGKAIILYWPVPRWRLLL
ncbi:signal peptidase I [Candidatus Formimonas warabiya]|uniref:Signal peptidase I n=1 Tax=Formimonas warabiya TaxID=1761012 RepID=A0A3G1KQ60_FORW1|nr:signal peptidase I [Candidatus Formimonas warabiya]ATW24591.1 signal peptidase I [Candidatus Formimonas warabiya]